MRFFTANVGHNFFDRVPCCQVLATSIADGELISRTTDWTEADRVGKNRVWEVSEVLQSSCLQKN
eukprot:scaffold1588_cov214-Alexandrium_tamarense.AAC.21